MKILVILGGLSFSLGAFGLQVKTVRNYEDIAIKASIKEPNSLTLEDDRVQQMQVPANALADTCNGKSDCKLIDETTGIFTFMPSNAYKTQSFTINLLTEKGYVYNLRIEPAPVPSQTVLLKAYKKPVIGATAPQTSDYERTLVSFLKSLVHGHNPEGFTETIPKTHEKYRASRTELQKLLIVKGNDLTGEVFEIKNLINKPVTLKASWFNWPGTKGLALAQTHLKPFEKTRLYRIS
jgi:conjugal transfer pilus assembly protein TraK